MKRLGHWLTVLALTLGGTTGCAVEQEPAAAQQAAESREITVLDGELGGSYDFAVAPMTTNSAPDDYAKVVRFSVKAGETFAAVMRRSHGEEVDAYLRLYADDPDHALATSDYDQALIPMGVEEDAVIVHTAEQDGELLLFAADRELAHSGGFQLDLMPIAGPAPTDLTITHAGLRHLRELLAGDEPEIEELAAMGAVSEGSDGLLQKHPLAVESLADRAALIGFVARHNDVRGELFRSFAREDFDTVDETLAAQVGLVCGSLWSALRSPEHNLRRAGVE
jgi:hypothetical protein